MPLKKPSEFYDKKPNSSFDNVKEELKNAKPEKVERISEAIDSFKGNLNNLQTTTQTGIDTRPSAKDIGKRTGRTLEQLGDQ